jgi:hypothetical protein
LGRSTIRRRCERRKRESGTEGVLPVLAQRRSGNTAEVSEMPRPRFWSGKNTRFESDLS